MQKKIHWVCRHCYTMCSFVENRPVMRKGNDKYSCHFYILLLSFFKITVLLIGYSFMYSSLNTFINTPNLGITRVNPKCFCGCWQFIRLCLAVANELLIVRRYGKERGDLELSTRAVMWNRARGRTQQRNWQTHTLKLSHVNLTLGMEIKG